MHNLRIGAIKINGASGFIGIGTAVQWAPWSVEKSNTGNATVNGDSSFVPVQYGIVSDPDIIDSPLLVSDRYRLRA